YQILGEARGGAIRTLSGAPIVPFRLGWRPEEALAVVGMQLVDLVSQRIQASRDRPECRTWEDEILADKYGFEATFAGGRFREHKDLIFILPPYVDEYFQARSI